MKTKLLQIVLTTFLSMFWVHLYADCSQAISFKDNYVNNVEEEGIFFIKGVVGEVIEYGRSITVIEDLKGNFTGETSITVWGAIGSSNTTCKRMETNRVDYLPAYRENDTLILLLYPIVREYEYGCEIFGTYATIPCAFSILTMENGFVTGYIDFRQDAIQQTTMSWEDLQTLLSIPINTHCSETSFKENYVNNYKNDDVIFVRAIITKVFNCDIQAQVIEDLKGNFTRRGTITVWGGDCYYNAGDRLDILSQYQENDQIIMLLYSHSPYAIKNNYYLTIPCAFSILKSSNSSVFGRILPTSGEFQYPEEITMTWEEFNETVLHPTATTIQPITGKHAVYQQNGTIFFENSENASVKLSFYDLSGKLVHEAITTANSYRPVLSGNMFVCTVQIHNELQTITYIAP